MGAYIPVLGSVEICLLRATRKQHLTLVGGVLEAGSWKVDRRMPYTRRCDGG